MVNRKLYAKGTVCPICGKCHLTPTMMWSCPLCNFTRVAHRTNGKRTQIPTPRLVRQR